MSKTTSPLKSMTGLSLGAAFLMANSSIGPGFLTQTSFYTETLMKKISKSVILLVFIVSLRNVIVKRE